MGPSLGVEDFIFARSVEDLKSALGKVTIIMLNYVCADVKGNIGWQTSGRIPVRSQGESTIPYEVKDGRDNWIGWIPFDKMPQLRNPSKGWV